MPQPQNNVRTLRKIRPDADPGVGGFWPDVTAATTLHKLRDRLFIGDGALANGNRTGTQSGKVPTSTEGASWASRDSQVFSFASTGLIAGAGFSRSSDQTDTPTACIGWAGFVINDKASGLAWGLYSDVQHESGASASYGLEVAAKNKGSNVTGTPYGLGLGVEGARFVAGGDASYGGSPANPSKAGIVILGGASTWNDGILFEAGGLTETSSVSRAVSMGVGMRLYWYTSGGNKGFAIRSDVNAAASDLEMIASANVLSLLATNGKNLFQLAHQTNGVNYIQGINAATGGSPRWNAVGDDTNISVALVGKGTGGVSLRDGGNAFKFEVNTTGIGFYGATPAAKPTITGSRSGNAALADLLTDLATLGLITDSTTA